VTSYKIPILSCADGKVSGHYNRNFIKDAAKRSGIPLPPDIADAMAFFNEIADSPNVRLQFMLEPGEIMMLNNFTVLHARTGFEDSAERKRYLLRMWLDVPNGRGVVPIYHHFTKFHDAARREFEIKVERPAQHGLAT